MPRAARSGAAREPAWLGGCRCDGQRVRSRSRAPVPSSRSSPAAPASALGYRLRDGSIEVLYWPGYDRPRDGEPAAYALLSGVTQFRLSYLDGDRRCGSTAGRSPAKPTCRARCASMLTLASGEAIERWLALR